MLTLAGMVLATVARREANMVREDEDDVGRERTNLAFARGATQTDQAEQETRANSQA